MSRLNNISGTTSESRESRGWCLLDFFSIVGRLSEKTGKLLYRVCTKKVESKREKEGIEKHGGRLKAQESRQRDKHDENKGAIWLEKRHY